MISTKLHSGTLTDQALARRRAKQGFSIKKYDRGNAAAVAFFFENHQGKRTSGWKPLFQRRPCFSAEPFKIFAVKGEDETMISY